MEGLATDGLTAHPPIELDVGQRAAVCLWAGDGSRGPDATSRLEHNLCSRVATLKAKPN